MSAMQPLSPSITDRRRRLALRAARLVELIGIEPTTSALQGRRSPS
jgi:hypothetical protein